MHSCVAHLHLNQTAVISCFHPFKRGLKRTHCTYRPDGVLQVDRSSNWKVD